METESLQGPHFTFFGAEFRPHSPPWIVFPLLGRKIPLKKKKNWKKKWFFFLNKLWTFDELYIIVHNIKM